MMLHDLIRDVYLPVIAAALLICGFFWRLRVADRRDVMDILRRVEAKLELLEQVIAGIRADVARVDERTKK